MTGRRPRAVAAGDSAAHERAGRGQTRAPPRRRRGQRDARAAAGRAPADGLEHLARRHPPGDAAQHAALPDREVRSAATDRREPPAGRAARPAPPPRPPRRSRRRRTAPVAPTIRWDAAPAHPAGRARPEAPESDSPADSTRALGRLVEKLATFGGWLEELSPSDLVAVFGMDPVEDAPTRAALAALALKKAAAQGQPDGIEPLEVRVALHVEQFTLARVSGRATLGQEAKREARAVLKDLLERAGPDEILIAGPVAPFLDRRFELVPAGAAGSGRPAYRLAGSSSPAPRGRRLAPIRRATARARAAAKAPQVRPARPRPARRHRGRRRDREVTPPLRVPAEPRRAARPVSRRVLFLVRQHRALLAGARPRPGQLRGDRHRQSGGDGGQGPGNAHRAEPGGADCRTGFAPVPRAGAPRPTAHRRPARKRRRYGRSRSCER